MNEPRANNGTEQCTGLKVMNFFKGSLSMDLLSLETQLNTLDIQSRKEAIRAIHEQIENRNLRLPAFHENCNLHAHTFFSYNAYGHSPSSLVWLARREGIRLMGIVDFDTLEGTDEFLWACDQLDVSGTVSLETRIYLPEFADRVITSKGQPGVAYYLLSGFTTNDLPPQASSALAEVKSFLIRRNEEIINSLNRHLAPLSIDYEADVLSLSAGDTPTERHIMEAYYQLGKRILDNPLHFWSRKLGINTTDIESSYSEPSVFRRMMRDKLVKAGGIASREPDNTSYPSLAQINQLADLTGTLPTLVWANGTSQGEREEEALLEFLIKNGLFGLNVVPDRSINVHESEKAFRLQCLREIVDLARQSDLPIFIGTEMNQPGHRFVDDLDLPELFPFKQTFLDGAYLLYGHTMLSRQAGLGYRSGWSNDQFQDRRSRNAFFTSLGRALFNNQTSRTFLQHLPPEMTADDLLALISNTFS